MQKTCLTKLPLIEIREAYPHWGQLCFFLLNHCCYSLSYDCKNTYYSLLPVSKDDKACANLIGNCWTLFGALPALRTVNQTTRQTTQVITNSLELSTDTLRKLPQVHNWFVLVRGYDPSLDDLKLFASDLLLSQASVQLRRVWNSLPWARGEPILWWPKGVAVVSGAKIQGCDCFQSKVSVTGIGFKRQGCSGTQHKPQWCWLMLRGKIVIVSARWLELVPKSISQCIIRLFTLGWKKLSCAVWPGVAALDNRQGFSCFVFPYQFQ